MSQSEMSSFSIKVADLETSDADMPEINDENCKFGRLDSTQKVE